MQKNPARGDKVEKHHPEGKNVRRTLSIQREDGIINGTKIFGKCDISKDTQKERKQNKRGHREV